MRAEERHTLKENELARMLASAQVYLREKGKMLGIVVIGVVALLVAVQVASSSRAAQVQDAWRQMAELNFTTPAEGKESIRKLSALIGQTSDAAFVRTALLEQGTQGLRLAQKAELPPDTELNDAARAAFESLLQRGRGNAFARAAAHSGLATVAENDFAVDQNPRHREEAERHLKALVEDSTLSTTPFYSLATERLARLGETFAVVRFAAAPPPAPPPAEVAPPAVVEEKKPAEPEEPPAEQRRFIKVRMTEDGTLEAVDDDE